MGQLPHFSPGQAEGSILSFTFKIFFLVASNRKTTHIGLNTKDNLSHDITSNSRGRSFLQQGWIKPSAVFKHFIKLTSVVQLVHYLTSLVTPKWLPAATTPHAQGPPQTWQKSSIPEFLSDRNYSDNVPLKESQGQGREFYPDCISKPVPSQKLSTAAVPLRGQGEGYNRGRWNDLGIGN